MSDLVVFDYMNNVARDADGMPHEIPDSMTGMTLVDAETGEEFGPYLVYWDTAHDYVIYADTPPQAKGNHLVLHADIVKLKKE